MHAHKSKFLVMKFSAWCWCAAAWKLSLHERGAARCKFHVLGLAHSAPYRWNAGWKIRSWTSLVQYFLNMPELAFETKKPCQEQLKMQTSVCCYEAALGRQSCVTLCTCINHVKRWPSFGPDRPSFRMAGIAVYSNEVNSAYLAGNKCIPMPRSSVDLGSETRFC